MTGPLRALWLTLVVILQASMAFATDTQHRQTVRITIAGGSASTAWLLMARLAPEWPKLDATIVTTVLPTMTLRDVLAPSTAGEKARVWIDLGNPRVANVFVVEGGNVYQRTIALAQGYDDVALELLDVVITSAVQAVLAGEHLGVPRAQFDQAQDAAANPAGERPARRSIEAKRGATTPERAYLLVGITYQGTLLGPGELAHGPGVEAQVEWRKLRVGLELRGRFANRVANDALSLAPQGVRWSVGRVFSLGPRWQGVLSIAGGVDISHVRSRSTALNLTDRAPFWSLTPVLSPLARVEYRLNQVRIGALLGADWDFRRTSYVASTTHSAVPIWAPWRLRPVAGVAVSHAF